MRSLLILSGLVLTSSLASAECDTSKTARDAVRAMALISDRAMITDLVGGTVGGEENVVTYNIWANYRHHNYADNYQVAVQPGKCRVMSLKLLGYDLPVKDPS